MCVCLGFSCGWFSGVFSLCAHFVASVQLECQVGFGICSEIALCKLNCMRNVFVCVHVFVFVFGQMMESIYYRMCQLEWYIWVNQAVHLFQKATFGSTLYIRVTCHFKLLFHHYVITSTSVDLTVIVRWIKAQSNCSLQLDCSWSH